MNIIQKNFDAEIQQIPEIEIRIWLEKKIRQMLDQEPDLLWSTLYRMDVEEEKIKKVMSSGQKIPVETGLADLILERQKLRNEMREKYSSPKTSPGNDEKSIS